MSFATLNLHPSILSQLHVVGYKTPTPIQRESIPAILKGQDLMGLAETGTGKTAAFILPMLQRLMTGPRGRVRGLIIAPTRELAQQTHETIGQLGHRSGLRSAVLYGGVSIHPQKKQLQRGIDIAVACPGRLLDHVRQRTIDLSSVEMLVLDEADQMFDMGFFPNTRQILQHLPRKRQSLLFSATMPQAIRQLASEILHKPITVQISANQPVRSVEQLLFPVSQAQKTDLLLKLLKDRNPASALIFARTKLRASRLAKELKAAGYEADSLQGDLSQNARQRILNFFRSGKLHLLVATDIVSRGIDVAGIALIINFDMPDTVEAYTHRIGRTGRAKLSGEAYSLVTREDAGKVRAIERLMQLKLPERRVEDFAYQASSPAKRPASRGKNFSAVNQRTPLRHSKPTRVAANQQMPTKHSKSALGATKHPAKHSKPARAAANQQTPVKHSKFARTKPKHAKQTFHTHSAQPAHRPIKSRHTVRKKLQD